MRTRAYVSVCVALFVVLCASSAVGAGEVTVSGLHICCGACVKAIDKALAAVDGVSDVDVDREAKELHFQVGDAETGRAALKAVVKAGYFGQAKYDGRGVDMPHGDVEKDAKADRVVFENVHICCKGCAKAIAESVKDKKSVAAVDCDTKKGTVAFNGTDMNLAKLLEALHKSGFHGTVKQ